ncbi:MAG TPA: hypothetical protein VNF72_17930 [Myxococcota bacterium]|jgi:hypothetical protein|nr:hypothetical protein [Myxococcota bacterium]
MTTRRRTLGVCGAAAALGLLLAGVAGADPAGAPLAPPGECAQAREALGAATDDDGFAVAGSPLHHFTPGDVALGSGVAPGAPPGPPTFTRDPCDAPLAGCASILDARRDVVVEEPGPGTDPSPGTGQGGGGR